MDDVVAVVTDLMTRSRIAAAAQGRRVRYLAGAGDVQSCAGFALALVDLDARLDVPHAIRTLRHVSPAPIVAFGPHLDTERRKAARAAGADRVLARSKFVTELPNLMNNNQSNDVAATLQRLQRAGANLQKLGQILQDPQQVQRLYFAPSPHMQDAASQPVVIDELDVLPYVVIEVLEHDLARVRGESGS